MRWISRNRPKPGTKEFVRGESGQSLIVVAMAIVALIAIIGLGVDLGVIYVERVRLARAMDAAALAGAKELPIEEASHRRALEYLVANEYGSSNACIETLGSDLGESCSGSNAVTIITIDTAQFRAGGLANSANRINVRGTQNVDLLFMRVLGFEDAPVAASATAENIDNLDIALVYDRSGSMQEDTRCYGCWEPIAGQDYPIGNVYPLPFEIDPGAGVPVHCLPSDPVDYDDYWYISIEAEHYSQYAREGDYHRDSTEWPKIWWALQRTPNVNASSPDARGAFMRLGPDTPETITYPNLSDILYPPDVYATPRLDYDFTVPANDTYYVWMRAQGGRMGGVQLRIHAGLDGVPMNTASTVRRGPYNRGADPNDWRWTRALELDNLSVGQSYTLSFWAAATAFRLDKIVITNDPRSNLIDYGRPLGWDSTTGVTDAGPAETHGRTNWACHPLDPRFEPVDPIYGGYDDLYDDTQPIRAAKEAAKNFVERLNPDLDQMAYVEYSTSARIVEELYCVKRYGSCEDFSVILDAIEATHASGSTNIGDALWDGIRVLTTGAEPSGGTSSLPSKEPGREHYGRPNAAHILVLMTDGQANKYPSINCYSDNLWPDQPGENTSQRRARECVAWFAHKARDQGVVIYSIGLGAQADHDLLRYAADVTGGGYYYAPSADRLESIFENLYERIFLRLVD